MPCYAGLDCSKHTTSICVLGPQGETLREGDVPTSPEAIISFLRRERRRYVRVGLESWSLAPWLHGELVRARLPAICIEARHAHGVLKARLNKTDRNDARGIAEMMRAGLYRPVHVKSEENRRLRVLFSLRRTLLRKQFDLENVVRAVLLQFGLKMPTLRDRAFERAARTLLEQQPFLQEVVGPLLRLRQAAVTEVAALERGLKAFTRSDPICRRLETAPGVGPLTALAFRIAIDDPARFVRSRDVGPHLGLTPRTHQSGAQIRRGQTSGFGDVDARSHLFIAAQVLMRRGGKSNWLRSWGEQVAGRRGRYRATVAVARRLAVVLHRMWIDESDFRREMSEDGMAASAVRVNSETHAEPVIRHSGGVGLPHAVRAPGRQDTGAHRVSALPKSLADRGDLSVVGNEFVRGDVQPMASTGKHTGRSPILVGGGAPAGQHTSAQAAGDDHGGSQ